MTDNSMNAANNAANVFVAEQLTPLGKLTQRVNLTAEKKTKSSQEAAMWHKPQSKIMLSKLQLAQIIEAQVKKQLDRFKEEYNKRNTASHIDFSIVLKERAETQTATLAKVLEISMTKDGISSVLFRTAYGFSQSSQVKDEGEWMLTIWNEAQYNLIGGGIAYALNIAQQRKTTQHG